jgi:hypothetical protein
MILIDPCTIYDSDIDNHRHSLSCCFKQLQTTTCILFRWELITRNCLVFLECTACSKTLTYANVRSFGAAGCWTKMVRTLWVHGPSWSSFHAENSEMDGRQGWPGMGRMCQMGMVAPRHFVLSRGHLRVDSEPFSENDEPLDCWLPDLQ